MEEDADELRVTEYVVRYLRNNIGLISAIVPIAGSLLYVQECFNAARLDPQIGLNLATDSSPADVVKPVIIHLAVIAMWLIVALSVAAIADEVAARRRARLTVIGGGVFLAAFFELFVFMQSVTRLSLGALLLYVLAPVALPIAAVVLTRRWWPAGIDEEATPKWSYRTILGAVIYLGVIVGLALALHGVGLDGQDMWRPAETVTVKGQAPQTVYVIRESDDALLVLDDRTRTLRRIRTADVIGRAYCYWRTSRGQPRCPP